MHVHGLAGKFAQNDQEVRDSALACLKPLADARDKSDVVMPAFSSGQWAGTLPLTLDVVPNGDVLFMCGGGILAHPQGVAAGVASIRQAWQAWREGRSLVEAAKSSSILQSAIDTFGKPGH